MKKGFHLSFTFLVLALVPALAVGQLAASTERPRLVVLSWDGAPDWVVDRLLAEGKLPHLSRLAARGATAEHSISTYPSKTAVGHAALWTGCGPGSNGVAGNSVLRGDPARAALTDLARGFSSAALRAEPLWITAARAGRSVVVLSATQSHPPPSQLANAPFGPQGFRTFSGFDAPIAPARLYGPDSWTAAEPAAWARPETGAGLRELVFRVGETPFFALDEGGRLVLRQGDRSPQNAVAEAVLSPLPAATEPIAWSPAFSVRRGERVGGTAFRLFALGRNGGELALYQRPANALEGHHSEADLAAYVAAYPAFHDEVFKGYRRGLLGPTLIDGGDGTAERRALEIAAHDTHLVRRGTRFALERWRPDLLVHYSPLSDAAGHAWMGVLDPESPAHDAALATKLWPFYARVFQQLDAWLGDVVRHAPPETVIVLVTDHGMAGVARRFHTHRVLEQAGLLARQDGRLHLARTQILAAESDFFLRVNDRRREGGIVAPEDRAAVLEAAAAALLAARDPANGNAPVRRLLRPRDLAGHDLGGPGSWDLFLDTAPGYYPSRRFSGDAVATSLGRGGSGEHGFDPERRTMQAIFYVAGPGVRRGVTVPPIHHFDIAPTLARLLGVPAPPCARGRVIEELLVAAER